MHTAFALKQEMFSIAVEGRSIPCDQLTDWGRYDRLGVLVRSPYGALGAGLFIQLITVAFYDVPDAARRCRSVYPDIYLFHFGGPWGNHWAFDFWPDYKEVFVEPDRQAILNAFNQCGITHLLLPDRERNAAPFRYTTRDEALLRTKRAFVYSETGSTREGDISIDAVHPALIRDYRRTLYPTEFLQDALATIETDKSRPAGSPAGEDARYGLRRMRHRLGEVPLADPQRMAMIERLEEAEGASRLTETYRGIEPEAAFELL